MLNIHSYLLLRIFFILIFVSQQFENKAQDVYEFTAPSTTYSNSYKNIDKNAYNKEIINFIKASHPIYITGTKIRLEEKYIQKQLLQYETTFPLHLNYFVRNYIRTYATKNHIGYASHLYNYFSPQITKNIKNNQLPDAFKFIPLVCSGFNPLSDNKRGGIGFWQLNYIPAVKYGLVVNKYIDERRDFEKSTQAATKYIKDIYTIYNDWELTLAAYSCGIVTVNKALLRTEGNKFWDIYPYLPKETRDIVPALTAMVYCFNEAGNNHYLLDQIITENDTVYIPRNLKFKAIEDVLKVKSKQLSFLNPIINSTTFPSNYMAILPIGACEKYTILEDSIYYYQDSILYKPKPKTPAVIIPKDGEPFVYSVKSGDVLGAIAERYNVRVSQIQDWNNINGTRIDIGQKLTIYGPKGIKPILPSPTPKPEVITSEPKNQQSIQNPTPQKANDFTYYTVKSGDSLWLIAKKYSGVSSQNIMDFNKIGDNLTVGQVLKIPKY